MATLPLSPFDPSRHIGTICQVDPSSVRVNLPQAATQSASSYAGFQLAKGQVGEFVFIEGDQYAIIGRITEVRLPEKDRLSVEPGNTGGNPAHPVGVIQIMSSIDIQSGQIVRGIPVHPRISQHVFSAHPLLIKYAVEAGVLEGKRVLLANLSGDTLETSVLIDPAALFGRHCAVLGATGGGKSWTVGRIVEEIQRLRGKVILFDATGEFETLSGSVEHVYLGGKSKGHDDHRTYVSFPYFRLTDADWLVMFNPTGASQAPKLREAIKSLKLAELEKGLTKGGLIVKLNTVKKPIEDAMTMHSLAIDSDGAMFDINLLAKQVQEECVYPSAKFGKDHTRWGDSSNEVSYVITLVARIESATKSPYMACIFQPSGLSELPQVISDFLESDKAVLRISMQDLPFEHNSRELVANAVGRFLLRLAREERFSEKPCVVVLDEAHQFLDKSFGDEYSRVTLDSFGLIAKEGRKYGLTILLATQRPRDIPEDVLSQMGMFIVHRLINERDRQVVEKACGNLDEAAAAFLPTLGQGEAVLVGVDSPMPLPVQIVPPKARPKSHGPKYGAWG